MTAEELKKKTKTELISALKDCREQLNSLKDERDLGIFWEEKTENVQELCKK